MKELEQLVELVKMLADACDIAAKSQQLMLDRIRTLESRVLALEALNKSGIKIEGEEWKL